MNVKEFEDVFPNYLNYFNKLDRLARLVEAKSKQFNITAIRNYEDIWQKHIIDSLMVVRTDGVKKILSSLQAGKKSNGKQDRSFESPRVLDIGTGAGFPGFPLAIVHPHAHFVLVDSTRKKVEVVKEFVSALGLSNVECVWGRAEELSKNPEYEGRFDLVVARQVAYLPKLLGVCAPFIKQSGQIALYKEFSEEEIKDGNKSAVKIGLENNYSYEYKLPGAANTRVILFYRWLEGRSSGKTEATQTGYVQTMNPI